MTWNETEKLANECLKQKLTSKELVNVANNLPLFDCCNFVIIMKNKGVHIAI